MNNLELEKKIRSIISEVTETKGYISSIDVIIKLGYLSLPNYENWRNGKIQYLEKVCTINLSKLTTINKIMHSISKKMNLEQSLTVYNKFGKGKKQKLRFCKS